MQEFIVYIVKPSENRFVKIGMTTNLKARLDTFQTGSPFKIELVHKFICRSKLEMQQLERDLHSYLKSYRVNFGGGSEWFKIEAVGQLVRRGRAIGKGVGKYEKKNTNLVIRAYELFMLLDEHERYYYETMKSAHAAEKRKQQKHRIRLKKKTDKVNESRDKKHEREMLDDLYQDYRDSEANEDPDSKWYLNKL